ncbi:MAG: hypothetical protein U0903_09420 [Planctomycetales bacterium]
MMATALGHSSVDSQCSSRPLRYLAIANLGRRQTLPVLIGALGFFGALLGQFSRNLPSVTVARDFNIGLGLGFASLFLLVGLEIFQARFQCRERTRLQSLLKNSAPLIDVQASRQAAWSWVSKVMPVICLPILLLVPFQPQPRLPSLMLTALGLCLFVKFVFQAMSIQRERIALFDQGLLLDQPLGTAFYPWECFQEIKWREQLESLICKVKCGPKQFAQVQTISLSFLSPADRQLLIERIEQHVTLTRA